VHVNLAGRGRLTTTLQMLPKVLAVTSMHNRSALYKLAEVARVSESLAWLKMNDKEDNDSGLYRRMRQELLPFGLDYHSLLTLAKILGG